MLTPEQARRYARATALPDIGEKGQEKLLAARVMVVGAGALGSAALSYLAASGIGTLGICDADRVELSNLPRQILHETADIGRAKVESARDRINELNPDVTVITHSNRLTPENAESLVARYDVVVDGSDNFPTRFAVNEACHRAGKPLVSAALRAYQGEFSVFTSYRGPPHPCYRCFVSGTPEEGKGCEDAGVPGPLAGLMGSHQALAVFRLLTVEGLALAGHVWRFDTRTFATRAIRIPRDPACPTCGRRS